MPQHTVSQGECMVSIADRYGFFWQTLWNHPQNAALKQSRKDASTLYPGDIVFVPEKRIKRITRPTTKRHRFRVKGVPAKLRLRILEGGEPRTGEPYSIVIDGVTRSGVIGAGGFVEISIPPGAQTGKLIVGHPDEAEEYDLKLGCLDPLDEITGIQARLGNIGFYNGPVDGMESEELRNAMKLFQGSVGLRPTGKLDADTRESLAREHDI